VSDGFRVAHVVVSPSLGAFSHETATGEVFHRDTATVVDTGRYEGELDELKWSGAPLLVKGQRTPRRPRPPQPGITAGVVTTPIGLYGWDGPAPSFYVHSEASFTGVDATGFWSDESLAGGRAGVDGGGLWFSDG
jgi:hypothetical protein